MGSNIYHNEEKPVERRAGPQSPPTTIPPKLERKEWLAGGQFTSWIAEVARVDKLML